MDQLGKESISQASGAIKVTHLLDDLPDLRKPPDAQNHTGLDRRLSHKLKTYGLEDPPVKREKATPLGIIHSIVAAAAFSSNPKNRLVANLGILGLYFCLRLC